MEIKRQYNRSAHEPMLATVTFGHTPTEDVRGLAFCIKTCDKFINKVPTIRLQLTPDRVASGGILKSIASTVTGMAKRYHRVYLMLKRLTFDLSDPKGSRIIPKQSEMPIVLVAKDTFGNEYSQVLDDSNNALGINIYQKAGLASQAAAGLTAQMRADLADLDKKSDSMVLGAMGPVAEMFKVILVCRRDTRGNEPAPKHVCMRLTARACDLRHDGFSAWSESSWKRVVAECRKPELLDDLGEVAAAESRSREFNLNVSESSALEISSQLAPDRRVTTVGGLAFDEHRYEFGVCGWLRAHKIGAAIGVDDADLAAGTQSLPHALKRRDGVRQMLEHESRPNEVDGRVRERQLVRVTFYEVDIRNTFFRGALSRFAEKEIRHVYARNMAFGDQARQVERMGTGAASQIDDVHLGLDARFGPDRRGRKERRL